MEKLVKASRQSLSLALVYCVFMLVVGLPATAVAGGFGDPEHKVVIQVSADDPMTQRIALNNAVNLQKEFGLDNVEIEIVAYGPGLSLLTKQSEYPERVPSLAKQGVRFSACHNTMEAIERKTGHMPALLDGVEEVPSGVARVAQLQEQGYAYVRP